MENGGETNLNDKRWKCRHCIDEFEIRGQRNAHQRNKHQTLATDKIERFRVQRTDESKGGKFACQCGKEYSTGQSLQRHSKGCIDRILMDEDDLESIQHEECNAPNPDVIALQ